MQNFRTLGLIITKVHNLFNLSDKYGKIIRCEPRDSHDRKVWTLHRKNLTLVESLYCLQQKTRNEPTKGHFVPKPLLRAIHLSRLGLRMTRLDYVNLIYEQGHH